MRPSGADVFQIGSKVSMKLQSKSCCAGSLRLFFGLMGMICFCLDLEWVKELSPVAVGHRVVSDSVAIGPKIFWEVIGSEQTIDEWEMDCIVDIDCFLVDSVMPMMESRCRKDESKETEISTYVRVNKYRRKIDKEYVGVQRG